MNRPDPVISNLNALRRELPQNVTLVAVSKTIPPPEIQKVYDAGQRDFGENRVQELMSKQDALPPDIRWHLVGRLQNNKVKHIAPFIHLIHSVDSVKLLQEINEQGGKNNRVIPCLLQVKIAKEESKHGMSMSEVRNLLASETTNFPCVKVSGLMGMATFTQDEEEIRREFRSLRIFFKEMQMHRKPNMEMQILSMGMSGDYRIALQEGSSMVRIGRGVFGVKSE